MRARTTVKPAKRLAIHELEDRAVPATIVVSPGAMGDWAYDVRNSVGVVNMNPTAGGQFVTGPAGVPLGAGSARLFTGNGVSGGDGAAELRNTNYVGTLLSNLTALSYSTHSTQWNGQQLPYLVFEIDNNGDLTPDDRIFFEPAFQTPVSGNPLLPNQGSELLNTWQTWDALAGGWWSNNAIAGATPGTGVKSLADYVAVQPTARIVNTLSGLGGVQLRVGFASATDQFNGYVDNFTIGTGTSDTFNFENIAPTTVYVNPAWAGTNLGVDPDGAGPASVFGGDAFATIQAGINAVAIGGNVIVAANTYNENIVLNKQVNLQGAQAGVDARGRVAVETILSPAIVANPILLLQTGSASSTIDGFTFSGGTSTTNGQLGTSSGPIDNLQILNNRFVSFTGKAVNLNDNGRNITVNQNVFDGASNTSAVSGIFHLDTDTFDGLYFTNNDVLNAPFTEGFYVDGNRNVKPSVGLGGRSPLISGNKFNNNNVGMNIGSRALDGAMITNNEFLNNNFDGLQGGPKDTLVHQNIFFGNDRWGMALTSFGNTGAGRGAVNVTVTENFFQNNTGLVSSGDILISSAQPAGNVASTRLFSNSLTSLVAISYAGTELVQASGNWWNVTSNPEFSSRFVGSGTANIDYSPWLYSGTDMDGVTPGFQASFANLGVDDDSALSTLTYGSVTPIAGGYITEGYDLLTPTGTLRVLGGTYTENVDLGAGANKAVTLAPGASPAQVTINGNLTFTSNDTYSVELNGTNAATDYDNLIVNGTVDLGGATLAYSGTYAPYASGDVFTIIDNNLADTVVGTFSGLNEGTALTASPFSPTEQAYIRYGYGAGNNNVAIVTNTPPSLTLTLATVPPLEGANVNVTVTASDPDVPPDSLSAITWYVENPSNVVIASGSGSPITFFPPDNGTYEVVATVSDSYGETDTETLFVNVQNVHPTATQSSTLPTMPAVSPVPLPGYTVIARNSPYTFTLTGITDPAINNDSYTIRWDWDGDGVLDLEDFQQSGYAHGGGDSRTYDFPNLGNYTVRVTVSDEDGGSTQYTFPVTVVVAVLQADGYLHVGGTDGNNTIMYDPGTPAGMIRTFVDGVYYGQFNPANGVRTFAGDGNDSVTIIGTTGHDAFGIGVDVAADLVRDKNFSLNSRTFSTLNAESYFLKGGEGNDTFNVSGLGGDSTPTPTTAVNLQGDNGDDVINASTLLATDVDAGTSAADWLFQGPQRGTLEGVLSFNTMQAIVGTGVNDTVQFVNGGSMPGYGANPGFTGGDGDNTLDLSAQLSAATIFVQANGTLNTPAGNYAGIDSLMGTGGSDKLVGANLANTWTVTGANSGTFQGGANPVLAFSSIESHQGNAGVDTFIIPTGGTLSGSVDGNTGTGDILNLSGRTGGLTVGIAPATVKDASLASPFNVVSGYTAIESIIGGSGSNTLTASNVTNTWTLTGANDGTLNALSFTDFGTLVGGTSNDTYRLGDVNGSAVSLVGGSGTDTLTYSAAALTATPVNVTLTSTTSGTETRAGTFTGIESLVGSTGSDTLTGTPAGDSINVTGANAGTINSVTSFSSFENLVGAGGNDTYTLTTTLANPVTSINGGGLLGVDTLIGSTVGATYVMSALGTGTYNGGATTFTNIENLTGGSGADTFNFTLGSLAGLLNGGSNNDTLNVGTADVVLTSNSAGTTPAITGGFTSIENLLSSGGTLTAPNTLNTWRLTGTNVNDVGNLNSVLFFNGFANYVGGNQQDRLLVSTGRVSGTFDGGLGTDIIDYSGVVMTRPYNTYPALPGGGLFRSGHTGNTPMTIANFEQISNNL